ncbi:MAG: ATP-binding protein [Gammaproteobacteria bacterium]
MGLEKPRVGPGQPGNSDAARVEGAQRELEQDLIEARAGPYIRGMKQLVSVVQRLSLARNLDAVTTIVRHAARELTGADGATFVLREGDRCFYADEEAISPLWKGQRFPLHTCISGWAMVNRQQVVIEDIFADDRIPHEAYRPTFVKSLVMTPIRTVEPIGAIGTYWAHRHLATPEELNLLQALADSTSIAMEASDVFANLEKRVAERTAELDQRTRELELLNRELESFSYSVAHDLRAPLTTIDGFCTVLNDVSRDSLNEQARGFLAHITSSVSRMNRLIEDLLGLSKIVRAPMVKTTVDLTSMAREIAQQQRASAPQRDAEFSIAPGLTAQGDAGLLRIALENLLANAWKFTSKREHARIEFTASVDAAGNRVYVVRDNGAGFDPRYAAKLFGPFQRCHSQADFPGTGIGLATVQRIVHRHGGKIRAEAQVGEGAKFLFTLPQEQARPPASSPNQTSA